MQKRNRPDRATQRRGTRFAIAAISLLATAAAAWAAVGNLDTTFGSGGVVLPAASASWPGSTVQPDGKIVVCGSVSVGGVDPANRAKTAWFIRRFNADGTDDTGFGTGGAVTLFGDSSDGAREVAIDGAGRAVLVGKTSSFVVSPKSVAVTDYLTIARLNADGSVDTGFGTNGSVRVVAPGSTNGSSNLDDALALQPDGSIVVAGRAWFVIDKKGTTRARPFLARYGSNGGLDPSFGSGGYSIDTRAGESTSQIWALARQSTGHHVLAQRRNSVAWVITRFLPSGAVDTAFTPIVAAGDYIGGLAVDRFDRIVATGRNTFANGQYDALVVRYTASGAADATFGSSGRALVHASYNSNTWTDARFQAADDKIVIGANVLNSGGGFASAATIRLLDTGALDSTYGTGGVGDLIDPLGGGVSATSVNIAPDGKLLLVGGAGTSWMLLRYDVN